MISMKSGQVDPESTDILDMAMVLVSGPHRLRLYCMTSTYFHSQVAKMLDLLCESNKVPNISRTSGDRYVNFLEKLNLKIGQVYISYVSFGLTYWWVYDQICYEKGTQ